MTRSSTQKSSGDRPKALEVAIVLGALGLQLWLMVPEHRRKEILLRLTATMRTRAAKLALRVGGREMEAELRGDRPAYEVSYWLSRVRDGAQTLYERLRSA